LATVDGFSLRHCFGFAGWVVSAVVGVEVQDEESGQQATGVYERPRLDASACSAASFSDNAQDGVFIVLFFRLAQIFVCVWDSVFRVQHFRLDLDYAYHVGWT
jgi:hypothetical protein